MDVATLPKNVKDMFIQVLSEEITALEQEPCFSQEKSRFSQEVSQESCETSTDEPMTMVYPTIFCDDAISRADVISVINILADKMDESGKTTAEQFISAIKDMEGVI